MNTDFWITQMKVQCGTVATIRSKMTADDRRLLDFADEMKSEPQMNAEFWIAQMKGSQNRR
jgi:hypothetical protein